jgi:hypothetical protein
VGELGVGRFKMGLRRLFRIGFLGLVFIQEKKGPEHERRTTTYHLLAFLMAVRSDRQITV